MIQQVDGLAPLRCQLLSEDRSLLSALGHGVMAEIGPDERLMLAKPDVVARGQSSLVVAALDSGGFSTRPLGELRLPRHRVGAFYRFQWNNASAARRRAMEDYLASGPMQGWLVACAGREVGLKREIRARLHVGSWLINGVHVADSRCDAVRELEILDAANAGSATSAGDPALAARLSALAAEVEGIEQDRPGERSLLLPSDVCSLGGTFCRGQRP